MPIPTRSTTEEFRAGLVKATVLRRGGRGGDRYTVTLVRLYRDGRRWRESKRLEPEDLPLARLALDRAHTWVLLDREARRDRASP